MRKIAFCPADSNNSKYFGMLQNSLRKFHSEEELPLIRFDNETGDPDFFYKATPLLAKKLMDDGYDAVLKLDADSIITGKLDHIWEGDYDVAVVQNANPREFRAYPYQFMNIDPLKYYNCGFVVMKSKEFVEHWLNLCNSPLFISCQMREQDLLNILCLMNFKVKKLDESDKWHGLISKGYWNRIELKDGNLLLAKNDEWPQDSHKQIVAIHIAGGNNPAKMRLGPYFASVILHYLEDLTGVNLR